MIPGQSGNKRNKPYPFYERSALLRASSKVLEKSQQEKLDRYFVEILGKRFIVEPNVFSPAYNPETEFFAREVTSRIQEGERFLDIGPGIGASTVFAALKGADVVAVEINPSAAENIQKNVQLHGVGHRVSVRIGDVYSPILPDEKFDVIYWNPPFLYVERENLTDLEKSVFDSKYQSLRKYITNAKNHLKENGRLLLGFSTTMGFFEAIQQFSREAGLTIELLFETDIYEALYSTSFKYELYQLKPHK